MREGEPSRTAFGAAALRAVHQDVDQARIFEDPLALQILGDEKPPDRSWNDPRLRLFIAIRHRFAEDSLAAAVSRGTRQIVVLGAGLDTFAYRNPFPGTTVYEVDFPATGRWKREQLAETGIVVPANVVYVAVDFEVDSLGDRLAEAGFDRTQPGFFLWLGVVPYLTTEAVNATLGVIADVPGGEVVLDYINPVDEAHETNRVARAKLTEHVADVGEPLGHGMDTAELHERLRGLGFTEIEDIARQEIRSRYLGLPPGDSAGDSHVLRARVGL